MKRGWKIAGGVVVGLIVVGAASLVGLFLWLDEPRPQGAAGPEADAMAERMMQAVGIDAWEATGAVRWTFRDRCAHLWDRERHFVQVECQDWRVLLDIDAKRGVAWEGGEPVSEADLPGYIDSAYSAWANDSFWLGAPYKAFDGGTSRKLVERDGQTHLLVEYSSGGVTPGDAYLWRLDEQGRPEAWFLWVSIIPVGGLEFSWEDWIQLPTGAWLAQTHHGPGTVSLTNIAGAATLAELVDPDPFAPLE